MSLFSDAAAVRSSFYGRASGFLYMTNVGCTGTEKRLIDCSHSGNAINSCGDGSHAGVKCLGTMQYGYINSDLIG
jgi:hypothetical protein